VPPPLHSVGIQAHLDLAKSPFSQEVFAAFLNDIANLELAIVISELDVKEYDYTLPPDERDWRVAAEVKNYLDVALAEPAVKGLINWGLSDRRSWLYVTDEDYARYAGFWKATMVPASIAGCRSMRRCSESPCTTPSRRPLIARHFTKAPCTF
jgi:endo-1,4-beta-xylanase